MSINSIFAWIIKKRIHQIDLFRKYPLQVQTETLDKLVKTASTTEFGARYNFDQIENYSDFRMNIPLQEYEDLQPWVERIMQGEQKLLWPTETKWFAKSSGTTAAKSKLILNN